MPEGGVPHMDWRERLSHDGLVIRASLDKAFEDPDYTEVLFYGFSDGTSISEDLVPTLVDDGLFDGFFMYPDSLVPKRISRMASLMQDCADR